jgi:hypothetical protein
LRTGGASGTLGSGREVGAERVHRAGVPPRSPPPCLYRPCHTTPQRPPPVLPLGTTNSAGRCAVEGLQTVADLIAAAKAAGRDALRLRRPCSIADLAADFASERHGPSTFSAARTKPSPRSSPAGSISSQPLVPPSW